MLGRRMVACRHRNVSGGEHVRCCRNFLISHPLYYTDARTHDHCQVYLGTFQQHGTQSLLDT